MDINAHALLVALFVGACRLAEITYGELNARRMLAEGGREYAPQQRLPVFAGYTLWLCLLVLLHPHDGNFHPVFVALFSILQMGRWWAMAHLGKYWTTRIVVIPLTFRITTGPYRFLKHPIYIVLLCEVMALSLAFNQLALGCIATGLTALWIRWRIAEESRIMAAQML